MGKKHSRNAPWVQPAAAEEPVVRLIKSGKFGRMIGMNEIVLSIPQKPGQEGWFGQLLAFADGRVRIHYWRVGYGDVNQGFTADATSEIALLARQRIAREMFRAIQKQFPEVQLEVLTGRNQIQ